MAASIRQCFFRLFRSHRISMNSVRCSFHTFSAVCKDKSDEKPNRYGNRVDIMNFLSQRIDLSPLSIERWLKKKVVKYRTVDQSFVEKRYEMLGPDLSASHFIVFRGGAVRFQGQDNWHRKDKDNKYNLPSVKIEGLFLEAIDASNTKLVYEGFENFKDLEHLKWLSLKGCQFVDDWCISRLHLCHNTLEYLDISECPLVTDRGISSLHQLSSLKILKMNNMGQIHNIELLILMLEDSIPNCKIEGVTLMNLTEEQVKENLKKPI